jgi:hypothetical protein
MQHPSSHTATQSQPVRELYFELFKGSSSEQVLERAEHFLCEHLEHAASLDSDLPADMNDLFEWMQAGVEDVGISIVPISMHVRMEASAVIFVTRRTLCIF